MIQEYVESYGNQLAHGNIVFNAIYTSPGRPKSCFYIDPSKRQNMWMCQLRQLPFQISTLSFGQGKNNFHKGTTYVT